MQASDVSCYYINNCSCVLMLLVLTASTEIVSFDFSALRINYEIPNLSSLKIRHFFLNGCSIILLKCSATIHNILLKSRSISFVSTISRITSPNAKASLIILQIDLSSSLFITRETNFLAVRLHRSSSKTASH